MNKEEYLDKMAECLEKIKKENDKRNLIFHETGIDLTNYQNDHFESSINSLCYSLAFISEKEYSTIKDFVEWWLFDSSIKEITIKKDNFQEEKIDVSMARDLINMLLD